MKLSAVLTIISDAINGLTDYFDTKIVTGKVVGDAKELNKKIVTVATEETKIQKDHLINAKETKQLIAQGKTFTSRLLSIPILGPLLQIIITIFAMVIRFYADIFIVFAITFPLTIFLAVLFQQAIILFFIALIPIILIQFFCVAALFLFINTHMNKEHVSLLTCFHIALNKTPALSLLMGLSLSVVLEVIIGFVMFSYVYSNVFSLLGVSWNGSFVFWLVVVILGLCIGIVLFILFILTTISFFLIVFEKETIQTAPFAAWRMIRIHQITSYLSYMLLIGVIVLLFPFIVWNYLYIGISMLVYIHVALGVSLGFVLYKMYYTKELVYPQPSPVISLPIIYSILFFGIINFTLIGFIITKQHSAVLTFFSKQKTAYYLNNSFTTYTNTTDNYSIDYPKTWTIYEHEHTTTIYNNETGTLEGGVWITIDALDYTDAQFMPYYNAPVGRIDTKTDADTITYKLANNSLIGYKSVTYTHDQNIRDTMSYQTIYLIKHGSKLYQVTFTARDKNVRGYSYDVIDTVISSFTVVNK